MASVSSRIRQASCSSLPERFEHCAVDVCGQSKEDMLCNFRPCTVNLQRIIRKANWQIQTRSLYCIIIYIRAVAGSLLSFHQSLKAFLSRPTRSVSRGREEPDRGSWLPLCTGRSARSKPLSSLSATCFGTTGLRRYCSKPLHQCELCNQQDR